MGRSIATSCNYLIRSTSTFPAILSALLTNLPQPLIGHHLCPHRVALRDKALPPTDNALFPLHHDLPHMCLLSSLQTHNSHHADLLVVSYYHRGRPTAVSRVHHKFLHINMILHTPPLAHLSDPCPERWLRAFRNPIGQTSDLHIIHRHHLPATPARDSFISSQRSTSPRTPGQSLFGCPQGDQ